MLAQVSPSTQNPTPWLLNRRDPLPSPSLLLGGCGYVTPSITHIVCTCVPHFMSACSDQVQTKTVCHCLESEVVGAGGESWPEGANCNFDLGETCHQSLTIHVLSTFIMYYHLVISTTLWSICSSVRPLYQIILRAEQS